MLTVLPRKTHTLFVAGSVGGTAEEALLKLLGRSTGAGGTADDSKPKSMSENRNQKTTHGHAPLVALPA